MYPLPQAFWRFLTAKRLPKLENFPIEGEMADEYYEEEVNELRNAVFGMKHLKNLHFDVSEGFDVTTIPFHELNQQQITYDIHVSHSASQLDASKFGALIQQNIDFLAVNNAVVKRGPSGLWEHMEGQHLKCQDQTKNKLFLNLRPPSQYDLSSLLTVFHHISVLDLSLNHPDSPIPDPTCIQRLHDLKHLFIAIRASIKHYGQLFANFAEGLQGNNVLSSITLHLQGGTVKDFGNTTTLKAFLGACATTVTEFLIKLEEYSEDEDIEGFYESMRQLKNLRYLHIEIVSHECRSHQVKFDSHMSNLAKLLEENHSMEELIIKFYAFKCNQATFDFKALRNMKGLRKLTLNFGFVGLNLEQLQHLACLSSLNYIEFTISRLQISSDEGLLELLKI